MNVNSETGKTFHLVAGAIGMMWPVDKDGEPAT
jgi:hypothetical protein